MNKKQLLERKAEVIEQMESMLDHCELEQRNFDKKENSIYLNLEKEVRSINEQLNEFTNLLEMTKGENNMGFEKREYAKGLVTGEIRSTVNTQGNIVPAELYDEVVKKIVEMSNVVADADIVHATGNLDLLIEKEALKASIVDEIEEVAATPLSEFEKVTLMDRRMAELILVSKKLLLNTPIVGINYITDTLAKRCARKMEEQLFNATGKDKEFTSGLLTCEVLTPIVEDTLTINDLQNLITSMPAVLLNGAKLYCNRSQFQRISLLQDGQGHFYLTHDIINNKPVYMICGIPIEVTEEVSDKIVLANVGQAMKLKMGESMNMQVLTEKYATSGQIGVLAEVYCDAALVDKQAVKVLAM